MVLDGVVQEVHTNSLIHINVGMFHTTYAKIGFHIIEIQLADVLNEEDIERFEDWWITNEF